jgi:biopolymer transport protein ExbB
MTLTLVSTAFAQTLSTASATVSAVATAAGSSTANPYGLGAIWSQGDWVAKGCLLLLAIMSIASWYVLVTKFLDLRRLKAHSADAHQTFSQVQNFSANVAKLSADNPLRFVADAGHDAARQFVALKPRVDYDTWTIRAIEQALSKVQTRMQEGMAVLATIGSTAPFVGLFGTVWAIYTALVKIGASGQASIDRVAGPVGEALIMTAIGLAVAVPAVFGYNWLLRKNKLALESMRSFGAKLHILLLATTYSGDTAKVSDTKAAEAAAADTKFSETKPQALDQS